MVSRKTSLPYPTSPPPPPPVFAPPQPNHNVDTTDLPPIPTTTSRRMASSPFQEVNPWDDETSYTHAHPKPEIPDVLKPAGGRIASPGKSSAQELADAMRPGWSGEHTPRSSFDSQRSRDFWESSDDEESEIKKGKRKESDENTSSTRKQGPPVPSSLQIRRKPVGNSPVQTQAPFEPINGLASKNPFRRGPTSDHLESASSVWGTNDKGKGKEVETFNPHPAEQTKALNSGSTIPDLSAYNTDYVHNENAHWDAPQVIPPPPSLAPPPVPSQAPPSISDMPSPFSSQPPLIPVSPTPDREHNPWSTPSNLSAQPSPLPFAPSQKQTSEYTDDLLDRGEKGGSLSLGDELKSLPNHAPIPTSQISLLDEAEETPALPVRTYKHQHDDVYEPPPGPPPSYIQPQVKINGFDDLAEGPAPTKPPRPAIVTKVPTEQELAIMHEQRGETYHIKHFNWFDQRMGKMRSSSMLIQNENGPCPLLALVNALILGATDEDQAMLDEFLRTREQVTLGTIIENLMMELLSRAADGDLPDVDDLNRFLLKLRTGMNMNPRFVPLPTAIPNLMDARNSMLHLPGPQQPQNMPGGFEPSQDIQLYNSFSIQTVHGWLPEPSSDAAAAFARSAQSYEDAQAKLFGEDELEYKLSQNGLTPQEQNIWEDIMSMKDFLNTYQSQLTPHGLQCIRSSMLPGSFAILFRNDHFSTIYKHPRDGKLYSLVTDAGFADKEEIWQSLVDTSGHDSEFYSGDFKLVNHDVPTPRRGSSRNPSGQFDEDNFAGPMSPQEQQEQSDADYAFALQMQLEEEEDQRRRRAQSQAGPLGGDNNSNRPARSRRSTGNIPIPLRSNNSTQEVRPLIPPRNARSHIPAVNRPADDNATDTPPTYEEAARGKPYNPPIGSPLHPESSPTPDASPFNSSSQVNLHAPTSNTPRPNGNSRRTSAYHENSNSNSSSQRPTQGTGRFEMGMSPAYEHNINNNNRPQMPGSYSYAGGGYGGQNIASGTNGSVQVPRLTRNNLDRDRDCVVM